MDKPMLKELNLKTTQQSKLLPLPDIKDESDSEKSHTHSKGSRTSRSASRGNDMIQADSISEINKCIDAVSLAPPKKKE